MKANAKFCGLINASWLRLACMVQQLESHRVFATRQPNGNRFAVILDATPAGSTNRVRIHVDSDHLTDRNHRRIDWIIARAA